LYERIPVGDRYHLSYFDYYAWKQRNRVFDSIDVYWPARFTLNGDTGAEEVSATEVSDGFFRTLGVAPFLGRDFHPGGDQPSAPRTVMISYETWQKRFGANKNVVDRTITLDGEPYLIVGVLPPGFHFAPAGRAEFWGTLHGRCKANPLCFPYYGVARLKEGVSAATAFENVASIARQIAVEYPQFNRDRSATLIPLTDAILGDIRPTLTALLSGAGLLCLIGFVNVSSLLLVRSESRRREIAVRAALGASRIRLGCQFAAEGFLLAASGCGLGVALTFCMIRILAGQIPPALLENMPYLHGIHFNAHLLFFAVIVSMLGSVLFSIGPGLHFFLSDMQMGLMEGGRTSAGRGWRRLGASLVAVELAITVVLLVSAGLLAKSFYRLLHVDTGMSADHLAMAHIARPGAWYDAERNIDLERQVIARMSVLPGVTSVGVSGELALGSGEGFNHLFTHFYVVGRSYVGEGNEAIDQIAGVGYFETLQARLLQGRY
jgi:predicted permease